MNSSILRVVALVLLCVARLQAGESLESRTSLFNGTDLTGWVVESKGDFTVHDGVLRVNKGTGWLRSVDTYGDFTLVLEFRFLEAGANSGIFVRTGPTSKADENGWPDNGYQVQCMDTLEGERPLCAMIPYGAGEFQHEVDREALRRAYKPTGEWLREEITCRGGELTVTLNGTVVTRATGITRLEGHVGVQAEHGLLEFRKIEIAVD